MKTGGYCIAKKDPSFLVLTWQSPKNTVFQFKHLTLNNCNFKRIAKDSLEMAIPRKPILYMKKIKQIQNKKNGNSIFTFNIVSILKLFQNITRIFCFPEVSRLIPENKGKRKTKQKLGRKVQ